ncbi:hypothetical protein PVAP13_5KG111000 [Panicum virgatum]|uniref:Uncharacterized protein n=1 Tax=Panicum virgatum TaxID=38727 RepID=A0A8T0SFA9_PANVG|nr:hypothetical protein PVAP13_5KG111000 [Panicum virgatum]
MKAHGHLGLRLPVAITFFFSPLNGTDGSDRVWLGTCTFFCFLLHQSCMNTPIGTDEDSLNNRQRLYNLLIVVTFTLYVLHAQLYCYCEPPSILFISNNSGLGRVLANYSLHPKL